MDGGSVSFSQAAFPEIFQFLTISSRIELIRDTLDGTAKRFYLFSRGIASVRFRTLEQRLFR